MAGPLRGRRPRRAGSWGYRAVQLVTMTLAPIAVGFVRRPVVRQKGVYLRQIKNRGMSPTLGAVTFDAFIHPGIRRGKQLGSRWIKPSNVGV